MWAKQLGSVRSARITRWSGAAAPMREALGCCAAAGACASSSVVVLMPPPASSAVPSPHPSKHKHSSYDFRPVPPPLCGRPSLSFPLPSAPRTKTKRSSACPLSPRICRPVSLSASSLNPPIGVLLARPTATRASILRPSGSEPDNPSRIQRPYQLPPARMCPHRASRSRSTLQMASPRRIRVRMRRS